MPTMEESIINLIAARPEIRTIEIADELNIEPELVEGILSGSGIVVASPVTAPNGKKMHSYRLLGARKQEEKLAAETKKTKAAAPKKPAEAKAPEKKSDPCEDDLVELAYACIRANGGCAHSWQVHAALNLRAEQYASSVLAFALNDGRLVKEGKHWYIMAEMPEELKAPLIVPPTRPPGRPKVVSDPVNEFSCALWSDGELQLARGREVFAALKKAEAAQLQQFLNTLLLPQP